MPLDVFQSHLGSIGARTWRTPCSTRISISIPAWFDWRQITIDAPFVRDMISIPAWFDWRPLFAIVGLLVSFNFNPSLVRLARGARGHRGNGPPNFNPSLVRLARDN